MTAGARHGDRNKKLRGHILNHKCKAERANYKWDKVVILIPASVTYVFQQVFTSIIPQRTPATGIQVLKYMSIWGHLSPKLQLPFPPGWIHADCRETV